MFQASIVVRIFDLASVSQRGVFHLSKKDWFLVHFLKRTKNYQTKPLVCRMHFFTIIAGYIKKTESISCYPGTGSFWQKYDSVDRQELCLGNCNVDSYTI